MTFTSQHPYVVVGVDGSEESFTAALWAAEAAARRHAPLRVVHVWTVPVPPVVMGPTPMGWQQEHLREAAQDLVDGVAERLRAAAPTVRITPELKPGSAAAALLEASDGVSMLVVGASGLDRVSEFVLGSVATQVAAHASCPVTVVPTRTTSTPGLEAGRVVVGIDGSELSSDATHLAFDEASVRGCGLTLLHVWNYPRHDPADLGLSEELALEQSHSEELRAMAETVAGLSEKYPDVHVQQRLRQGRPAKVLAAASAGAALVVVGSRGLGGFKSLLLGSTSRSLLHHSYAPVLVVKPGSLR